ncbi:carbohydrate-binding module family 50 protein [Aaosphaeria arxii CBS 175.79]|uniref:Carbohydrate-binding module family 50 protein n=1 Tax=Aaosphaeria arxii CBS 175.79 TaxID=1450172 RepID=A0A6A5XIS7_9PLEO|nr:carbohydrate-binding module family 50 protein [Aaosphaeria arxii CBS 175.79]KAF2012853.1 carbohydrate-binding module family 50 protein [Aaosphaeria arxii CBS 175.79]
MVVLRFTVVWLLAVTSTARSLKRSNSRRQEGPVDPDTAKDCTYYDTALDSSFTCKFFEDNWIISHEDFVDWNPSVKSDCSGIKIGNSYCVEVNNGLPRPTSIKPTPTLPPSTTKPSSTGSPKPSPTQDGLIATCNKFYFAIAGDTCNKIVSAQGISLADFLAWNPAVGDDCSGLWAKTYYCVGIPGGGSITTRPPTPSTSSGPSKPSPTQDGLIATCNKFYFAVAGDTCNKIVSAHGISLSTFIAWNPAVGDDCSGLWAKTYYCVGIPGSTPSPSSSSPPKTTTPAGPSPTQDGIAKDCKVFYKAKGGDTCQKIVDSYGGTFGLADFLKWNPAVGSDCRGLLAEYYYCVGIPGTPTTKPPTTPSSTARPPTTTCNPSAPTPTQPGALCGCKKWHKVVQGNTCATIIQQYGIPAANFYAWNPEVGEGCKTLWRDYYVCVGR